MEDRGAQAAQAPYFTVTTVTTVTLGWQVFLPSKEYGIVMQSPLVVEGWQQIRILKKTCVGQTKNVCVLTRPVSLQPLTPHAPLTCITALGGRRRDDPCVTADGTGSEKAGIMVKATQQAPPCNAEA